MSADKPTKGLLNYSRCAGNNQDTVASETTISTNTVRYGYVYIDVDRSQTRCSRRGRWPW